MSNRAGAQKAIEHDGRNKTICKQLCVVKHVSSRQRMSAASQQKVIEHAGPQQDSCCGRSCCGLCNKTLLLRPLQQDSLVAASATRLLLWPLQQDSCCGLCNKTLAAASATRLLLRPLHALYPTRCVYSQSYMLHRRARTHLLHCDVNND
jgi:hypothetical protein